MKKTRLPTGEKVLPCKTCGSLPIWGINHLRCPKCGEANTSLFNDGADPKYGLAVRSWNRNNETSDHHQPGRKAAV